MPNLTIKGILPQVVERLKARARINHRSLNAEVIACLEQTVQPQRLDPEAVRVMAAAARARVKGGPLYLAQATPRTRAVVSGG